MDGRYKILDHLGAGGAGAVYKAYDTQLDRYVAIKRLLSKEEAELSDSTAATLKKEAASLATLQHPNIVSIYDLASDDGGLFIVMELLEGDDAADWLQRGPLPLADFKEFATQTLEGLLSAHQVNILHRDLKPENIKITRLPGGRLQAKIVDFGLARMSYAARKQSEDQSGNVLGSIYYMAPEQFIRQPLDGRTDLYSLGCVFYQALSGQRPFTGATVRDVMDAHLEHRVQNLADLCPHVPAPICDWVMWMMNQEQAQRPANAQAALDHLRALINLGWFGVVASAPAAQTSRPPTRSSSQIAAGSDARRPDHAASGAPRPAPGVFRQPGTSTAALQDAARSSAPVAPKNKITVWVYVIALAASAVVGWMFLPKGHSTDKHDTATNKTVLNANGLPEQEKDLLKPGAIIHYRAGEGMDPWLNDGDKPHKDIKPGDLILTWHDLERGAGDGALALDEKRKESCPKYAYNKPEGFNDSVGLAQFDPGAGMVHLMDKGKSEAQEYPFGEKTKEKGVTIITVVRPRMTNKEQRLFQLRNQDGNGEVVVRVYANNEFRCIARTRGKDGKDIIKEGKATGRSVKGFSLVTVTWDGKANKILMMVRSQDGNKSRVEFEAPRDCPVLNELHISDPSKDADKFTGDLVEMILWPFPMDWEPRSLQDQKLAEFYLTGPGKQFN